jgi:hypothetical protein
MNKDEALKLALEALESCGAAHITDGGNQWHDEKLVDKAITAIKQALAAPTVQEPVLQDIEQYRLQMAGISTAAIGYWKESDGIHPDYDTPALRDVAKLYAKYDALYTAAQPATEESSATQPVEVDQTTMELAESVGLIGPASRTHDLHAAIQRFHDLICVNATIKAAKMAADAIRESTPSAAPVAWKWHQAPVKTQWGDDMVVADIAIDKDHTVSVYCERDQKARVEAMFTTPPAAQRQWVDPNDKTQEQYLPHIGEPVLFCHEGKTYMGKHTGGSFQSEVTNQYFNTWFCHWMYLPAAHGIKENT